MPTPRKVRVAVIGCGVISELHLRCFAHNPQARVAAVCDLVPERAERAARERAPGARWTTKAAEIFADPSIDAVSICTDHASHARLACAALAAGKHVLCEKSLARTAADLRRMLAAAKAHPKLVAAGVFQHRFEPLPRVLRELVAEGAFGRLLTATGSLYTLRDDDYFRKDAWRGTIRGEGGSVLINQSIHYFDLLLWIAGGAASARAYAANLGHEGVIETEDTVSIALRMRNGALGSFVATAGLLAPSLLLLPLALRSLAKWRRNPVVRGLLWGVAPATVALMVVATLVFARMSVFDGAVSLRIRPLALLLAVGAGWVLHARRAHVTTLIVVCAAVGALLPRAIAWLLRFPPNP